jgi:hypothetical protein
MNRFFYASSGSAGRGIAVLALTNASQSSGGLPLSIIALKTA